MKTIFIIITGLLLLTFPGISQSGKIEGQVTDAVTGEPLPFTNVLIDGTLVGTTTDLDGNFLITGLEPGYIRLRISFIGYEPKLTEEIMVSNNMVPFLPVALEPAEESINEVTVTFDRFKKREDAPLAMQSIGVREIESNPGSNRDISRVIQSFPGVGSTPAFRNDVIIRGGGPSENRFYLDEVEIPVLNHFSTQGASGGPVGIINADFIQSVDFYSGSFPATKYNALSGMLDFQLKEGSREKTSLQATLGASEAALTLDGPVGEKSSYIFSVRRSYLQLLFSALGLPFLPTFNDYQLKWKTKLDPRNQLTIISIGSLDKSTLNTDIKNPDPSQEFILAQIPVNNQWSYTFGTVYKHFAKTGYHELVFSRNMLSNEFYKYPDNNTALERSLDYQSTEAENKIRYEFHGKRSGVKYDLGTNAEYGKYFNSTAQKLFLADSLLNLSYRTNLDLYKYGISGQVTTPVAGGLFSLTAGIRFDGNTYNSKMANPLRQFSPRASLTFNATEKIRLSAGTGRYFQLPAYTTLGYRAQAGTLLNAESAAYIGVNHFNAGMEYRITKSVLLSAEGFYKSYFDYPINLMTGLSLANEGAQYSSVAGASEAAFEGKGRAAGFELLTRVNTSSFTFLGTYTFVRSLFTNLSGEELLPSAWDSRHLLTLTGSKTFKNNWQVGFKFRYVGGLPYTPYDLQTSERVTAWDAQGKPYLDYSQANRLRFKAFHQLDIRVDKNFFFKKWALMLYLDIQNLYNFQAESQDYIVRRKNPDGSFVTTDNGTRYVLDALPATSGTVLPTFGIMIKL